MNQVDLTEYDLIVVNISGGKDSQVMLHRMWALCIALGIADRLVCVFADLGADDEWPGTEEMARYHASFYGARFIKCQKLGADGKPQSLLEYIKTRGMWPDMDRRYCTSDMKRGPISKVITALCNEVRAARPAGSSKVVKVLNCMGLRAEESPARAKKPVLELDKKQTGKGTMKVVHTYHPILEMTTKQVWAEIKLSGVKHHPIYDMGMKRLSCMFCVLAGKSSVARAAQLNPEGAWKRALLEEEMGHRFGRAFSMLDAIAMAEEHTARGEVVVAANWCG